MNMPYPFPNMPMVQAPFVYNKLSMAPPLYVGDLDENIQEETLHDLFSKFGPLHFVRIMRDPTTSRSRGFGYVNFLYPRDAESARQYAQYEKLGRKHIRIMFKRNVRDLPPEANVFVKNLDPSVTVKELHNHFSQIPGVLSAKVATSSDGTSLGYGYVQFEKKEDADAAREALQNSKLKENELQLLPFVPKDKRATTTTRKNIYVKHLPEDMNEEGLNKLITNLFSKYGELDTFVVKKHPKDNKYSAFVCFKDEQAASNAVQELTENPKDFKASDGPLYVNWHQPKQERIRELKRQNQQTTTTENNLYVKNLKVEVTEADLKNAFQQYGPITSIACKDWISKDSQKKARFGFIAFANHEDAQRANFEALNNPDVKNLYLPEAKPYINLHQSRESRKNYILSQRKWKQMAGMGAMGGMPGMPGMGGMQMPNMGMVNPNFGNMQMNGNRKFAPFPMMNQGMRPPARMAPSGGPRGGGNPRTHTGGWKQGGPGGPKPLQQGGGPGMPRQNMNPMNKQPMMQQKQPVMQQQQPKTVKPLGQQPVPAQPSSAITVQNLRTKLNEFLQLDQDKQRQILGELLFPLIKGFAGDTLAPKITGMLIDLSVLEVTEILEFLENPALLEERVQEAVELIESEGL